MVPDVNDKTHGGVHAMRRADLVNDCLDSFSSDVDNCDARALVGKKMRGSTAHA